MIFETTLMTLADYLLFGVCVFLLLGCIYISLRTRFVQLRFLPLLFRSLLASLVHKKEEAHHTILPHKALFTAMSTTLGISTIVAPVIAIYLGGPGALLGFLLTAFFGSAATYVEVDLCLQHRKKLENGVIMGGPMQYLSYLFSPAVAKWYAFCCFILMAAWSGAQANQLAAILNSPLLGSYSLSTALSGACIAFLVILTLMGGIKRISALSAKLVPIMFVLYLGSCFWILLLNYDKLLSTWAMILQSALQPYALASGTLIGGIFTSLRWGIFKGVQTCEAGLGTQSIPHSMAETEDPSAQATLAMLSTYTAGFIAFLSGCVALVTETWLDATLPLGISMVAASFKLYFSSFGIGIILLCTFLFAFGTILGNSYNGSQCFSYLTNQTKMPFYFAGTAAMIFIGAISEVKLVWSLVDIILACIALPHLSALILHVSRNPARKPVEDGARVKHDELPQSDLS